MKLYNRFLAVLLFIVFGIALLLRRNDPYEEN